VNTSYHIFTRGYATRENIASDVHSVKYISILHAKQTNILYFSILMLLKLILSKNILVLEYKCIGF
jgi:hypothetical protein